MKDARGGTPAPEEGQEMNARRRYRIALADDHPALRESVAAAVEAFHRDAMEVVAQAGDGVAALEQARRLRPDLLVLDLGMPRLGGLEALREIKRSCPETMVLVFSMYDDQAHVVEAIRAGADDYLFKAQARPADVANHIRRALEKRLAAQDGLHERLLSAIRQMNPDDVARGVIRLTGAELEILREAAHHGRSMKEIAQTLSGPDRTLSEHTVRKHLEHAYEKLGARSQAHAVCLAVKYGIISSEPAEPSLDGR
jgi:two-component system NarL family response regulator